MDNDDAYAFSDEVVLVLAIVRCLKEFGLLISTNTQRPVTEVKEGQVNKNEIIKSSITSQVYETYLDLRFHV